MGRQARTSGGDSSADGAPWGLAGLRDTWTDKETGEVWDNYTMLTINADAHPLMSRMHKPDPKLPLNEQDKRSVIPLEVHEFDLWLAGTIEEAKQLLKLAPVEVVDGDICAERRRAEKRPSCRCSAARARGFKPCGFAMRSR
ncbi:hypothetical protein GmRootV213_30520 [Variovorax sp. V213]